MKNVIGSIYTTLGPQQLNSIYQAVMKGMSIYDDKMRYSSLRLTQEMCVEENYRLDASGIADKVEEITPESLYAYYERAFMEDELDLYVIGDIDEEAVASMAQRYFRFSEREPKTISYIHHQVQEAKELQEIQDIKQGKLNIGYRTNITYRDADYFALQMFNGIFGSTITKYNIVFMVFECPRESKPCLLCCIKA